MEQILDQVDSNTEQIYAGFWVRVVAALIDGIVLSIVQWVVGFVLLSESAFSDALGLTSLSSSLVIGLVYNMYFLSSDKQATIGKQAMGIKVISLKGEKITSVNAAGRFLASYLSLFLLGFGYLMVAFDSRKQSLHDKLAGTYVVRK